MTRFVDNHYVRLGLPRDATADEIQKAYREAARRFHPDTRLEKTGTELFLGIQEAYEVLNNPYRRSVYDKTLPSDNSPFPATVSIEYSRTSLLHSQEPQLVYLLFSIKALVSEKENVIPPLNIAFVIDRSTSMHGLRMDLVKASVEQLLAQLRPEDTISVIAFSDRAEVIIPAGKMPERSRVNARISMIQTHGATEIFHGLNKGLEQVLQNARPGVFSHLILITDGHTYGDEQRCYEAAEHARQAGVSISGLGIGAEWNDEFLDKLTAITGGSSVFISNPKDLRHFFEKKFQGIQKTFAEALRIELDLHPDASLKYAFRLRPEPAKIPVETYPLPFGSLHYEEETVLILEFLVNRVPRDDATFNLAEGKIGMQIPSWVIPTVRSFLTLQLRTSPHTHTDPPPARLLDAMSKLTMYRMQEQAQADISEGRIVEATRRLQNLATNLLAQGESALATSVLSEARRLHKGENLSLDGEKRIKYGTRALMLSKSSE